MYQNLIINAFHRAHAGSLRLVLPTGETVQIGSPQGQLDASLTVTEPEAFKAMALQGDIGLGESYQRGYWTSPDLTTLIRWLLANSAALRQGSESPWSAPARAVIRAAEKARHLLNRNTRERSQVNIHRHYDLGNRFYQSFLDESMTYSSAYFTSPEASLEEAQQDKYERICRKLGLGPDHHLLEIGCGWGGFAIHAARAHGCRVTATTISREQFIEATRRVNEARLGGRIDLAMTDYRKLEGKFDRIASIEMLEAVGHEFLGSYFAQINRLLQPHGLAAVQVITCPNPLYAEYRRSVDWIQKHIFPGAHLPSSNALLDAAQDDGKLDLMHMESFGLHYAETLRRWRERFWRAWPRIEDMGFDEAFKRKWELYLSYCEAGFLERHINVAQLVFSRPDEKGYTFEKRNQIKQSLPAQRTEPIALS